MEKTNQDFGSEWAWLDATDQNGNALEGRDVLLNVRTHTILGNSFEMEFANGSKIFLKEDIPIKSLSEDKII
jgi:hypothetical protein